MNTVMLYGHIGRTPETRFTGGGKQVTTFSLAVRNPSDADKPDWFQIVCWEGTAKVVEKYTDKGSAVVVLGRLANRKWEDKEGKTQYRTEVVARSIELCGGGGNGNGKAKEDSKSDQSSPDAEPEFPPVDLNDEFDPVYGGD